VIILFWILTAVFIAADRLTKAAAEANIAPGEIKRIITIGDRDIFYLSLHHNTGAAFSSFSGQTVALAIVTAVALIGITVYYHLQKEKKPFMTVCYAMVIGGGIGNLIDRVFLHQVTDFLNLFPFSFIFNVADICVVIGAILLVLYYLFTPEKPKAEGDSNG
jgi:signal peptidase II